MAKSLISIDTIGFDLCSDIGDSVYRHKGKFNRHLINGYRKINTFIGNSFSVKTAVMAIDNAIEMPCDFIYETKVGVMDPKTGRIALLALDKGVQKEKLNDSQTQDYINDVWENGYGAYQGYWFYNAYNGINFLGELYGAGRCVINSGTYNIDKTNGVIYIGGNIPRDAKIVIEYKSDNTSGGLKLVPIEMKECLEFYAKWKFYADRNPQLGVYNETRYKKEYNQLQRFYNYENCLYATGQINEMYSPTNF
jgi:hypothetical protein